MSDAKRSVLAGLALLLASLLAAVLNPLAAAELKPWRYGVLEPKGDAGFTYMIDRGFAEKQDSSSRSSLQIRQSAVAGADRGRARRLRG